MCMLGAGLGARSQRARPEIGPAGAGGGHRERTGCCSDVRAMGCSCKVFELTGMGFEGGGVSAGLSFVRGAAVRGEMPPCPWGVRIGAATCDAIIGSRGGGLDCC